MRLLSAIFGNIYILLSLIVVVMILSFTFGTTTLLPWEIFTSKRSDVFDTISLIRLTRVLSALVVGGSLAFSGAVLQRLLKNPLADPYILGISSGGTLFHTLFVFLGAPIFISFFPIHILYALFGAFVVIFVLIFLRRFVLHMSDDYSIPLIGLIINSFNGAFLMLFLSLVDPAKSREAYLWMIGNLGFISLKELLVISIVAVLIIYSTLKYISPLVAMQFGDDVAKSVGFDPIKARKRIVVLISVLVAMTVSISGSIGFIGLIVPHLIGIQGRKSFRKHFMYSFITGGTLLMVADLLGRTLVKPTELPAGLFTAVLGAPLLVMIILRRVKHHGA